jgi:hypothetical protein
MTFASPRLIRKRPFICISFASAVQAIGSDVAAETNRSAVMSAPAKTVAVSRAVVNEVNIGNPFSSSWRSTHWTDANNNAGGVPIQEYRYFSMLRAQRLQDSRRG